MDKLAGDLYSACRDLPVRLLAVKHQQQVRLQQPVGRDNPQVRYVIHNKNILLCTSILVLRLTLQ